MKKILIAVLSAGVLAASCTKEAPEVLPEPESLAEQFCGEWNLWQISITSLPIDLNGDGRSSDNLLDEYSSMIGYWEPNLVATVEPALSIGEEDLPAVAFNVLLPYPEFKGTEEEFCIAGLKYLPISVRVDEEDLTMLDGHSPDVLYPGYTDASDIFLSGISEIRIIPVNTKTFWIRMECRMVDSAGDFSNGTMDFKYRKVVVE